MIHKGEMVLAHFIDRSYFPKTQREKNKIKQKPVIIAQSWFLWALQNKNKKLTNQTTKHPKTNSPQEPP